MTKKNYLFILGLTLTLFTNCNSNKNTIVKDNQKIIIVSPETKACDAGVMQKQCLQVKYDENQKDWNLFYDDIQGFNKEENTEYNLLVETENVENPPADASSIKYKLVKVISSKKM